MATAAAELHVGDCPLFADGQRVSEFTSGPVTLPETPGDVWLWAKTASVPGAPPTGATVVSVPPRIARAEELATGQLAAGTYVYLVQPFAEGESVAQPPAIWFRGTCGPGGRVVLDWSVRDMVVRTYFAVFSKAPAEGDEELERGAAELEQRKWKRGFRIWRQAGGDLQLVAELADDRVRRWEDLGVQPRPGPVPRLTPPPEPLAAQVTAGLLAPATYYYRAAARLPEGLTAVSAPVAAVVDTTTRCVRLRLERVRGATDYLVWRATAADQWTDSLVAVAGDPETPAPEDAADSGVLVWTDSGLPTATGTGVTVTARGAATPAALAAAAWQPVPAGQALALPAGTRAIEYRVQGRTDFKDQRASFARVLVADQAPAADALSPQLFVGVPWTLEPWMVPAAHAWRSPPSPYTTEATAPVVGEGRVRANAFVVWSPRGSMMLTRNYEVQGWNDVSANWENVARVRGVCAPLMTVYLAQAVTTRFRSYGPYASSNGAYTFDWAPAMTPVLTPVAVTEIAVNGQRLRDRPLYGCYVDNRIPVAVGENECAVTLTGLPIAAPGQPPAQPPVVVTFAVGATTAKELAPAGRTEARLPPGEKQTVRGRFTLPAAGEYQLRTTIQAGDKKYVEYTYWLLAGAALTAETTQPTYRGSLFASDPDQNFRFRLTLSAAGAVPVACQLREAATNRAVWEERRDLTGGQPAEVVVSAAALRYGTFRFSADAGALGRAERTVQRVPPHPQLPDAYLRADGVLMRGGRPFLPLCLWYASSGAVAGGAAGWMGQCGLNSGLGSLAGEEAARSYQAQGVLQLDHPGPPAMAPVTTAWDERAALRRLNRSTATDRLAWAIGEELDIFDETHVKTQQRVHWPKFIAMYNLAREAMPYVPIYTLAFDSSAYLSTAPMPRTADVLALEPYLYPTYSASAQQRSSRMNQVRAWLWNGVQGARAASRWTRGGSPDEPSQKALWATLQCWDGRCWRQGVEGRSLSLTEHRFLAYDSLLLGATGLQWYNYHCDYWHQQFNPAQWEGWRALVEELAFLTPMLLDTNVTEEAKVLAGSVDLGAREHEGNRCLIVANFMAEETRLRVKLPDRWRDVDQLHVIAEARTVPVKDQVLEDAAGPFAVHLYSARPVTPPPRLGRMLHDPQFSGTPAWTLAPGNLACEQNGASVEADYQIWHFPQGVFAIDGDPDTAYITAAWMKEPLVKAPWHLTVTLKAPAPVARVVVRTWRPKYWPDPVEALSDYDLELRVGDQWQPLAKVRDNAEEVRQHPAPGPLVEALRLTIHRGLYVNELEAYGPAAKEPGP